MADFRQWALSDDFPRRGRIDYVAGRIEVDTSPKDFYTHGTLKAEVAGEIRIRVNQLDLGHTLIAETRISSVPADLSAEPDVVVITHEALDDRRVRLVPKVSGEPDRYVEVEGAPDLIVEIVSDSSVKKDTQRLPDAYYLAGVREYWLIDARGQDLFFQSITVVRSRLTPCRPRPIDSSAARCWTVPIGSIATAISGAIGSTGCGPNKFHPAYRSSTAGSTSLYPALRTLSSMRGDDGSGSSFLRSDTM